MVQKWFLAFSALASAAVDRFSPATLGIRTAVAPVSPLSTPGKFAWEYPTANSVEAEMAVTNCSGTPCILFGDYTGQVHALNAATGKQSGIWKKSYQAGEMIRSTIAVFDSSLFFLDGDSKLYALDVNSGTEKWIFKTSAPPQTFACSSPVVITMPGFPSGDLAAGLVVVGSVDGFVYGVNASTGTQVWSYSTGKSIYASPIASPDNTTVYIGSDSGIMYALKAATGALKWQFQCADVIRSGSAIWNGALYFGTNEGVLYALDLVTGSVRFRFETSSFITAVPCIEELGHNAVVYIGSYDDSMYAINATTGVKLWSYATSDDVIAPASVFTPAASNRSTLYFGGQDGWFYAVDARAGSLVWKYHVDADLWSRPVFVQGSAQPNVVFGSQLDPDFGGPSGVWALTTQ